MKIAIPLSDMRIALLLAQAPRLTQWFFLGFTWMVAGYWASQWLAPTPQEIPRPAEKATAPPSRWISLYALPENHVTIQLRGVVTAGSGGVALLSVDNAEPQPYRVGRNVAPGVVLRHVAPLQVTLERRSGDEILVLTPVPALKGATLVAPRPH